MELNILNLKMSNTFNPQAPVRMVGLTKTGQENILWYNFKKYNNKPLHWIVADMKNRFDRFAKSSNVQVLQFYNNHTGELIEEFRS